MSPITQDNKKEESPSSEWMDLVANKVRDLRYGSVQITVHDGRVTLVESIEKTRFTGEGTASPKVR